MRTIIVILRLTGVCGLLALPAMFLPFRWMEAVHQFTGNGDLPPAPIVEYLARSLCGFYALFGAITLMISTDIRRHRRLVAIWGLVFAIMGLAQLGIDVSVGMPLAWSLIEGPPAVVLGLSVVCLQKHIPAAE